MGDVERQETRQTIGLLTHTASDAYGALLWAGARDAAKKAGANLICCSGWALDSNRGFEAQANILYELAGSENLDGLVISGGVLGSFVGPERFRDFCERYRLLPMASIALALEGIPSVLVENYQGIRDVMTHLVEVHGYQRIAFIKGMPNNAEAEARYQGYVDGLTEYGLPIDPALVSPSTRWDDISGIEAAQLLLDERGLQPQVGFDAIVTSSDNLAFGILNELQARDIRVPEDVAVTGFDAQERSGCLAAPLTSVRQPIYEQAHKATEMVLAQLRGENVPEQVTLPTELIVRQSCGCFDPMVVQAAIGPMLHPPKGAAAGETFMTTLADTRGQILADMVKAVGAVPESIGSDWADQLLDAFAAAVHPSGSASGVFLSALNGMLRQVMVAGGKISVWQGALSALHRYMWPFLLEKKEVLHRAEDVWQQARVMIGETAERAQAYRQLQAEQQAATLREIDQSLITMFDIVELMNVMAKELPRLDISGCYLSLYEGDEMPPDTSRLVLAYGKGERVELEPDGRQFPSRQLVPDEMLHREKPYSMLAEALYFRDDQIGLVLFEVEPQKGMACGVLRGQISSALKGALLLKERRQAETALEKAYAQVEKQIEERTVELKREVVERERAQAESLELQQEVIKAQKQALQELSTPIIPIMDRTLVMPLVGSIDSMRARDITRALLAGIRRHRAKVVILDITGVPVVDSGVADHLDRTIQAARLKGAHTIVTGVSDAVAETIVDLGIDWWEIETARDLQTGLIVALKSRGIKLAK
ncbi:MAG: substrate-binding domain-containing protein [Chloroflexi bacterium]|nr:substrate-binding domain-containing protein [Chloroflexota bacterium]